MNFSILFLCIILISFSVVQIAAQDQKGDDIDGEAASDFSGSSVDMPDANTLAIGAPNNSGNGQSSGHVRVYEWNGKEWIQKGQDIDGESAWDYFGRSVSMANANAVAVGAPNNDGNGSNSGHVRIFDWNGNVWIQRGDDIDGESADDNSGYSVEMPDVNTVAIGAIGNNDGGHIRVYSWQAGKWVQKGNDIDGTMAGGGLGWSLSMPDENTLATSVNDFSGSGLCAGYTSVYEWNGFDWAQKGDSIVGEATFNRCDFAVNMPDANTIAIGEHLNSEHGPYHGHVRIFEWNGESWIQKGQDIDGEWDYSQSGYSVSMPERNVIAIGAPNNDDNGTHSGHVRIYLWNGVEWHQYGSDIDGEASGDISGHSVSMPDVKTVGIGAINNSDGNFSAGHVRVFSLDIVGVIESTYTNIPLFYPNPTNGNIDVDFDGHSTSGTIVIRNHLGHQVNVNSFISQVKQNIHIPGTPGIYYIELQSSESNRVVVKVIKG